MTIQEAKRQSIPLMISLWGPSGGGKTLSALRLAAGLAGENGKVGFLDTELGRGSMYADDTELMNELPEGCYHVDELAEPFSPTRYSEKIKAFIKYGVEVLVIDSASHEWEGSGGCCDIAENNKLGGMPNWMKAKMEHKRLMNMLTQCPMHVIFCLRAREKSKPIRNDKGKIEMVEQGLQPICEKNFMYEMTLSMMLSGEAPGYPVITKCPKPLVDLFSGEQGRINKETGIRLREWADGGLSVDKKIRNLKRECREAAMFGSDRMAEFYAGLENGDKVLLTKHTDKEFQTETRHLAEQADSFNSESLETEPSKLFNEEDNDKNN